MKEKIILGFLISLLLCSVVSAGVVINEFLPNPSGSDTGNEWIELYNDGSEAVDLTGWTINDTLATPSVIVTIPDDTLIQQNDFLIFYTSGLNNARDGIKLIDSAGVVVDGYTYTSDAREDVSTGRIYDGASEWKNFTTPTPNASNGKIPVADAGQDQIVGVNTAVKLNGSGSSDSDGNIVSYNWVHLSGTSVSINNADSVVATFTPTQTGNYTFKLTVTDNDGLSDDDTVKINVEDLPPTPPTTAIINLTISDLDIKAGDDSDKDINERYETGYKIREKAKPGDKVKFDIEVKNTFSSSSNIEIDDINIEVTIKDIDDGDDLEADEDIEKDLDPGDDDSVTIEFEIPLLVKDDVYDVEIFVDAEDEKGDSHDIRWELQLEVKKDKHALIIDNLDVSPSIIRCERNPSLDIEVVNIGREDEDDVTIEIRNDELDIDIEEEDIELDEGDDEDSVFEKTYRLNVDDTVKAGTYPITATVYYDSKKSDEKTVDLIVEKCVEITTPLGKEPVDVIVEKPTVTKPTPVTTISFRETSGYLTLMIILSVILAGLVIFLIGAVIIVLRKR